MVKSLGLLREVIHSPSFTIIKDYQSIPYEFHYFNSRDDFCFVCTGD